MDTLYILCIWLGWGLVTFLITGDIFNGKTKEKRNIARAGTKRQVYQAKVNASKSVDARPRKTSSVIRSKKVVPWAK